MDDSGDTPPSSQRQLNRLANETSAYLRQHMYNPVDWYPWGEEAFVRARAENKPVLISIGYSACHWCHVMAHESFEHAESAALMNDLFINIKVDREERPDVDQIYMDTVVRLTGHGGWPLTVFATSDGRPFHAGTYYPLEPRGPGPTFRQLIHSVREAWETRREELEKTAGQILASLARRPDGQTHVAAGIAHAVDGAEHLMRDADRENGGFGGGPKFPTPTNLALLLAAVDHLPAKEAEQVLSHVSFSAIEMARRGLYDHLGGGFHRYCVDSVWGIPHFEKMLYDQGLLLQIYAELHRRTQNVELRWPIRETIAYLANEMTGPEGAFFASQDADSEGVEGKFYVWTPAEVSLHTGDEADAFMNAYGVTDSGNFEHGTTHLIDRARRPRERFTEERARLLAVRTKRVPPATDPKRVASWNGYAISGLARSASELLEPEWLERAARAADFVLERMRDDEGRLLRVFAEERAHVVAFLDDHAAMLEACLDLQRAGAGMRYLAAARELGSAICTRFYDKDERDLFLTPSDGEPLVHRPRSDNDGATPQATGLATLGLLRLTDLCGEPHFGEVARSVLGSHAFMLDRAPNAFPTLLRAAILAERGLSVAVVVGDTGVGASDASARESLAARARQVLRPEDAVVTVIPGETPEGLDPNWTRGREALDGRATAYVCHGTTCSLPIQDPAGFDDAS